jgi:hypothetical protein
VIQTATRQISRRHGTATTPREYALQAGPARVLSPAQARLSQIPWRQTQYAAQGKPPFQHMLFTLLTYLANRSSYFVGTGPSTDINGLFCASTLQGTLTNVYFTSIDGLGPVPPNPTLATMTVGSGSTVWADMIQVRWQSTDTEILKLLESTQSSSSSSTISSSQISTSASSTLPSNTGSGTPLPVHRSLSTASKVGIAVGICILALLLSAVLFWVWSRRRRFSSKAKGSPIYQPVITASHELDGRHNERPLKGELEGNHPSYKGPLKSVTTTELELDSNVRSVELPSDPSS